MLGYEVSWKRDIPLTWQSWLLPGVCLATLCADAIVQLGSFLGKSRCLVL